MRDSSDFPSGIFEANPFLALSSPPNLNSANSGSSYPSQKIQCATNLPNQENFSQANSSGNNTGQLQQTSNFNSDTISSYNKPRP